MYMCHRETVGLVAENMLIHGCTFLLKLSLPCYCVVAITCTGLNDEGAARMAGK